MNVYKSAQWRINRKGKPAKIKEQDQRWWEDIAGNGERGRERMEGGMYGTAEVLARARGGERRRGGRRWGMAARKQKVNCHFVMLAKRGLVGCGCVERQRGKEAIIWRFGAGGRQEVAFWYSGAQGGGAGVKWKRERGAGRSAVRGKPPGKGIWQEIRRGCAWGRKTRKWSEWGELNDRVRGNEICVC